MNLCPHCGGSSSVTTTKPVAGRVRRYRKCDACGKSWPTIEISWTEYKEIERMRANMTKRGKKSGTASGDARRGFSIPPDRRDEYLAVRRKTRMSARETAEFLGIIEK